MCKDCENKVLNVNVADRYDPTRTTVLRNTFVRASNKRFKELETLILKELGEKDVLQFQSNLPFLQKIENFKKWINTFSENIILEEIKTTYSTKSYPNWWWNKYITEAYNRGISRARVELRKQGVDIPEKSPKLSVNIQDIVGVYMKGEQERNISTFSVGTFHEETLRNELYNVFIQLKGVTETMATLMSKVVAEGIIAGKGAMEIAKNLLSVLSGVGTLEMTDTLGRFITAKRRAEIIARTETIRAYHLAAIKEYRSWGVYGATVIAEWSTAGDARVCEQCSSMEGKTFTLDEIEKMIPAHPQCRCVALPIVLGKQHGSSLIQ